MRSVFHLLCQKIILVVLLLEIVINHYLRKFYFDFLSKIFACVLIVAYLRMSEMDKKSHFLCYQIFEKLANFGANWTLAYITNYLFFFALVLLVSNFLQILLNISGLFSSKIYGLIAIIDIYNYCYLLNGIILFKIEARYASYSPTANVFELCLASLPLAKILLNMSYFSKKRCEKNFKKKLK